MIIFTNDDYRRIQAWLKANSVKDSELPHFTSENGSEKIAILQDGKNVLITLNELKQLVGGIVRVLTPPTISNVDNNVVIDAKIYDKIYFTMSTETINHYPYLKDNGTPIDENNTHEYTQPFSINKNVTVRAIAVYTNSEGEILKSNITEELVYLQKILEAPIITFKDSDNEVTLENPNEEGDIYYTLDGSIPNTDSTKYKGPFKIEKNCRIYAIVVVDTSMSKVVWEDLEFNIESIDIPTPDGLIYKGSEQTAFSEDVLNSTKYTYEGSVKETNAGKYSVTFILNDKAGTKWIDGTTEDKEIEWIIAKKPTTITWNTGTEYEVGSKIPVATSSDSFSVKYYRDNIEITLPYVLQNEDIGNLTIVAKNILSEDDKKNYVEKSVTKTFTIKEQSIPWQYACISEDDLDSIVGPLVEEFGDDAINKVSIDSLNGISFTQYSPNDKGIQEIQIESSSPILILTFPKNTEYELVALSTAETSLADYLLGQNYSEDVYITIYAIDGGGKVKLSKKEI